MTAPAVAVIASDPMTRDGASSYFRASGRVDVLPPGLHGCADVAVMFAGRVTEETLAAMQRLTATATNRDLGIVLVAEEIGESRLLPAVRHGMVGFVHRSDSGGMEQVLKAVLSSRNGRADLPHALVRSLIDHVRALQGSVLDPLGLDLSGLKDREIEVLRLLADGLDTGEVAAKLNYSERTIKTIVGSMTLRLGLRNRSHAIAYAIRSGAL
ncbi:transcriptional regulator, LuxR family [Actinacidiphila yanglinensis]|uniref:Transcriptional regulator, LuxR family n=1 Tax=Actinacidiphila yanglinensis TaxID=310779 RepID=A0A1H5Y407_9ACTN|nr:response regulator transcription factor [Actinacidiphila yanglinensis]SEG18683.1 transcriptional regulator, LuxR family [Actinacidiphila yanglinensis]